MQHLPLVQRFVDNLASLPGLLPILTIAFTLVSTLVVLTLFPRCSHHWLRIMAGLGLGLSWYFAYRLGKQQSAHNPVFLFNHLLTIDPLTTYFHLFFIGITLLMLAIGLKNPLQPVIPNNLEQVVLVLSSLLGACTLVMASHWLSIYLGLTLLSLASASLVYSSLSPSGAEASLKYLLYSMVTSALMLWGLSYFYGFTKTLAIQDPRLVGCLQGIPWAALLPMLLLLLSNILFVVAAVPFHFWVPDVYQGSAPSLVAYLATVPKLAGVAVLLRIFHQFMPQLGAIPYAYMQSLLAFVAFLTLLVGNAGALLQNNTQRMMAYASIAQGGLLMAGIAALPSDAVKVVYYSGIYGVASFAALVGVKLLHQLTDKEQIQGYAGLGWQFPMLGVCTTVFILTLIGLPPTAGFTGKLLIFIALWERVAQGGGAMWIALLSTSLISTLLSLCYYLKLPYNMFLRSGQHCKAAHPPSWLHHAVLSLLAGLLLWAFFNTHALVHRLQLWLGY